jgi:hypothetical protein
VHFNGLNCCVCLLFLLLCHFFPHIFKNKRCLRIQEFSFLWCHAMMTGWMLSLLFLFLKKLIIFSLRRKVYCLITLFLQSAIRTQHYNPCQCLIMLDFPIHVGYSEYMLSIDLCLLGAKAKLTWLILLGGLFFWTREVDYLVLVVPRRYQNDLANGLRIFYASEQHIRHYSWNGSLFFYHMYLCQCYVIFLCEKQGWKRLHI